jgi:hypothetical protein
MSTPIKGNPEIRSDREAFIDAYLRARDVLGRIDGVIGVGFGRKEKADAVTSDVSITVFVLEKKAQDEIPPEHRIPPIFDGYRTDVRVVPEVEPAKCDNQDRYPTIQGGIQIQSREITSTVTGDDGKGTLGCIVRKRGNDSGDNYYLLTADHALFHETSDLKSLVHHPSAPATGDTTSSQVIAMVEDHGVRREVEHRATRSDGTTIPFECYVDCAIARLDLASRCCGSACSRDNVTFDTTIIDLVPGSPANNITDVRDIILDVDIVLPGVETVFEGGTLDLIGDLSTATEANRVVKVGRTTGRTVGIVLSVNTIARRGDSDFYRGLIEIQLDPASTPFGLNCKGNPLFIEGGDSGSLVVDMQNRAVGLADFTQRGARKWRCFACHIVPVLDQLRVCIPTASGTGHGSSGATDGSGIAQYGGGGSAEHLADDGTVLFAGRVATAPSMPESVTQPPTAASTREQSDHIERFLDTLRESEDGRRLHDAYIRLNREIGYLIRNQRRVTVTWHRNRGPAFLAGLLDHLRGNSATIPLEIGGVSRRALLARMGEVLLAHGSDELRDAIEQHRDNLMRCAGAATVQECIDILRRGEEAVSK